MINLRNLSHQELIALNLRAPSPLVQEEMARRFEALYYVTQDLKAQLEEADVE